MWASFEAVRYVKCSRPLKVLILAKEDIQGPNTRSVRGRPIWTWVYVVRHECLESRN